MFRSAIGRTGACLKAMRCAAQLSGSRYLPKLYLSSDLGQSLDKAHKLIAMTSAMILQENLLAFRSLNCLKRKGIT